MPPHPDLLHSPSQTGVNALVARGEKETALRLGQVRNKRQSRNTTCKQQVLHPAGVSARAA
jgi:hypothetical protein